MVSQDDPASGMCGACLISPPGGAESKGSGPVAAPLNPGDVFKGYRIEARVGSGGTSVVYRAHQLNLERSVALKVLGPEYAASPQFVSRFEREARLLAGINHPHVVHVYEFGHVGDLLFIAMEMVDGGTLQGRFDEETPRRLSDTLALLRGVCDGLDRVHRAGLVHRDIKPSNILLTGEGEPKVSDFGLVIDPEDANRLTQTGLIVGTPRYMSPEQVLGQAVDSRSDLYSLGIVLYQALTGTLPFDGPATAVLVKQVHEPPPSPRRRVRGLPPALADLTLRLLAKKAADRPSTALEVRDQLCRAIEDVKGLESKGFPFRGPPRTRLGPLLAGVFALALGAGIAWMARTGDQTPPPTSAASASPVERQPDAAEEKPLPMPPDTERHLILGTSGASEGIALVTPSDGQHEEFVLAGKPCSRLVAHDSTDQVRYLYFDVTGAAFPEARNVEVEVEYFDEGQGAFNLQYDGAAGPYQTVPKKMAFSNERTWKITTFVLPDAKFGNRQNGGADFRVSRVPGREFFVHRVSVRTRSIVSRAPVEGRGLRYEYFEGAWKRLPDFDVLKPVSAGTTENFSLSMRRQETYYAVRFSGFVEIPRDGEYIFSTVSDDGSKLLINDVEVVSNDGLHGAIEKSGRISLQAGRRPITLKFLQAHTDAHLEVLWEGPGLSRSAIPAQALFLDQGK